MFRAICTCRWRQQPYPEALPGGESLAQWGTRGSAPRQFSHPDGVTVDAQGTVYVADSLNHRIQKLSSTGEPLAQWGRRGSSSGQFDGPWGVSVDAQGNLYVADRANGRIQKLSPAASPSPSGLARLGPRPVH